MSPSFSDSQWSPAMKDASLTFTSLLAIVFSLALMGVPALENGLGLGTKPSWHTITIAVLLMLTAAYIIIEAVSDVFSKKSKILQSAPGTRWRFLTLLLVLALVTFGLMYAKMSSLSGMS